MSRSLLEQISERVDSETLDLVHKLIAELGQEVEAAEPVGYMDPDADFMLPRKGQCVLSSQVVLVRDPHGKYTRPIYLSPAHTSEARDAARYRWIVENAIVQWSENTHIGMDPCSTKLPLDNAIDAAMRQEGGNE